MFLSFPLSLSVFFMAYFTGWWWEHFCLLIIPPKKKLFFRSFFFLCGRTPFLFFVFFCAHRSVSILLLLLSRRLLFPPWFLTAIELCAVAAAAVCRFEYFYFCASERILNFKKSALVICPAIPICCGGHWFGLAFQIRFLFSNYWLLISFPFPKVVNSIGHNTSCPDLLRPYLWTRSTFPRSAVSLFDLYTPPSNLGFLFFSGQHRSGLLLFFFFFITSNRIEMKNEGKKCIQYINPENKRRMGKEIGAVKAKEFGKKNKKYPYTHSRWLLLLGHCSHSVIWWWVLFPFLFFLFIIIIYSFTTATAFWSLIAMCDAVMTPATGVVEILISAAQFLSLSLLIGVCYRAKMKCFGWGREGKDWARIDTHFLTIKTREEEKEEKG